MIALLLLACARTDVTQTHTSRLAIRTEDPETIACATEPTWKRVATQSRSAAAEHATVTLGGGNTGDRCEVRLELRAPTGERLLKVTVPPSPGAGATSKARATAEAPASELQLWVAAIGPADATTAYTSEVEVVEVTEVEPDAARTLPILGR